MVRWDEPSPTQSLYEYSYKINQDLIRASQIPNEENRNSEFRSIQGALEEYQFKNRTNVSASSPVIARNQSCKSAAKITIESSQFGKEVVDHNAVLIARKIINGQCHFLLRNSEGNVCAMYTGEFKKSCEAELALNHSADVWIPAKILIMNMHGYAYLE